MNKTILAFIFSFLFNSFGYSKNTAPQAKPAPSQSCTLSGMAPPLAGPGYSDPKFCCKGNIIIIKKSFCENKNFAGFAGICSPCGNKFCESEWENSCNCPEDCPAP